MRNYFILFFLVLFFFNNKAISQCGDKGSIVISEIYFDTHYSEAISTKWHHFGEYIELFNSSNEAIDLKDWVIKDNHTEFKIGDWGIPDQSVIQYTPNTIIQPGGIKIITFSSWYASQNPDWYSAQVGLENPLGGIRKFVELFPQAAGHETDIILQNKIILYNYADKVSLYNPEGRLIHEISYNQGTGRPDQEVLDYMQISEFSIDNVVNDAYFTNRDGGIFNGPIGMINVLDPTTGLPTYNGQGEPVMFQSNLYQKSIYLTDEFAYYFDRTKNIQIGQATPFTIPYTIELLDVHPDLFSPPGVNDDNWIHSIAYDITSPTLQKISESRSYFDDLAKPTVSMSHDFHTNLTWGSETVYDSFGRAKQSSFPTVICNSDFKKINVLSDPIAKSTYLDYYYGDNNALNEFQATAQYPYTEAEYDPLNPGNVIRSYGGNKIETSPGVFEWKTGYSFTVPAAQEMHYVFGYNYFEGEIDGSKKEIATKFYKTITVDPHGIETAIFTDGEGKTLAIGKERPTSTLQYPVYSTIGTQGYVDVYIPARVSPTVITFLGGQSLYKIYNLKTGQLETSVSAGNAYRIEALVPPTIDPKIYVNMTTGAIEPEPTALGIKYVVRYYDYTLNYYDKTGRLIKTIQPNGFDITSVNANKIKATTNHTFATTYTYNTLGQLVETTSPDKGTSKYAYRNDGQIRYSQSALQILNNSISYTDYDTYGRPVESGVITGYSWNDAVANVDNDLPTASSNITYKEQTFSIYDFQGNTPSLNPPLSLSFFLNNADVNPANYEQHNLAGNVVTSWNNQSQSWYSYDLYGRLEWMVQNIEGLGAKTIDYEYNAKGQVKKMIYQRDTYPERFIHQYTYNFNGALESVATSTNDVTFEKQADYEYYIDGKLKRVVLAEGIQGTDYVYTLGGMLKSINHPSLDFAKDPGGDTNDVFGITLDYYSGDYKRAGKEHFYSSTSIQGVNQDNYDGNIKATRFATKDPNMDLSGGIINPKAYAYAYDHNKWLTNATFGNMLTNNDIQTVSSYKEGSLRYDANGNIRNLLRTDQNGTFVDAFKYIYKSGTNQLTRVDDTVASDVSTNDIDTQPLNNYGYDAIGQLIENIQEKLKYFYNTQGLVTEVQKDGYPIVKFYYNERGNRVKKESFVPNSTTVQTTSHYVLDASGNTIANYTNSVLQELPVYGGSRLGVYNKNGNFTNYQITDHLGNVRAVIRKNGTSTTPLLQQYADYYPFGEQLPNRNSFGDYMYAYQGQEWDSETQMEAFKLRLWDGRIGRWLSPDPYGQYHSPYLGMGNNPISMIDLDGGWADGGGWLTRFINWVGNGFSSKKSGVSNETDEDFAYSINLEEVIIPGMMPNNKLPTEQLTVLYHQDHWWNKLAIDGTRRVEFKGSEYLVDDWGYAYKHLGIGKSHYIGSDGALGFISGPTGAIKFATYSAEMLETIKFTELGAQSAEGIAMYEKMLQSKSVFDAVPAAEVIVVNGVKYLADGHHKTQGAINLGKSLDIIEYSGIEASKRYPQLYEQILNGVFK